VPSPWDRRAWQPPSVDPSVPEYGKIDLTGAAKVALRIAAALDPIQAGIEPRPQLQEVVDPEGGAAG
jgi:hypothetical protein